MPVSSALSQRLRKLPFIPRFLKKTQAQLKKMAAKRLPKSGEIPTLCHREGGYALAKMRLRCVWAMQRIFIRGCFIFTNPRSALVTLQTAFNFGSVHGLY